MIYNPLVLIPEPETAVLARGSWAWLLAKEFMNPDLYLHTISRPD